MAELDTSQPSLFFYEGLRNLTTTVAPNLNNLISKLNRAEAAEGNGNLTRKAKFINQYRSLVRGQTGTSLTVANANALITIASTL